MSSPNSERAIHLDAGQLRQPARNYATIMAPAPGELAPSFREAFVRHYDAIRRTYEPRSLGLGVVVVDRLATTVVARAWLPAFTKSPNALVIGRHCRAELYLDADPTLSLRHLVVLLHPATSWDPQRLRLSLLDLRTPTGFRDENSNCLEAVVADGTMFITCGRYMFFFLPTGDISDWPASAEDAWQYIPERIYVDERQAEPDRWVRQQPSYESVEPGERKPSRRPKRSTFITIMPPPAMADESVTRDGERPLGTLLLTSDTMKQRIDIDPRTARRGFLLGRYERCDSYNVLQQIGISRTHLLLLLIDNQMYALDTASTHGTYALRPNDQYESIFLHPLNSNETLLLAGDLARVSWKTVKDS